MRKCQIVVTDADESFFHKNDHKSVLEQMDLDLLNFPEWGNYSYFILNTKKNKYKMSVFEDEQSFLFDYSRALLLGTTDYFKIFCFIKNGEWKSYMPPTLIGLDLKTKLR